MKIFEFPSAKPSDTVTIIRSALEYRLQKSIELKLQCKEFFDKFGITEFFFAQFDDNHQQIDLCTNKEWINHYFANRHNLDISVIENMWEIENNKMHFWNWPAPTSNKTDIFCALNEYNIAHGLTIFARQEKSLIMWCFATTRDNFHIRKTYLSNLQDFQLFIKDFSTRGKDLIENCTKIKIVCAKEKILKNLYKPITNHNIENFKNKLVIS